MDIQYWMHGVWTASIGLAMYFIGKRDGYGEGVKQGIRTVLMLQRILRATKSQRTDVEEQGK